MGALVGVVVAVKVGVCVGVLVGVVLGVSVAVEVGVEVLVGVVVGVLVGVVVAVAVGVVIFVMVFIHVPHIAADAPPQPPLLGGERGGLHLVLPPASPASSGAASTLVDSKIRNIAAHASLLIALFLLTTASLLRET